MKSKIQKSQELAGNRKLIEKAKSLLFVNFSGTPVMKIHQLKKELRENQGFYSVMKKRLFKILFQEKNLQVDMDQFDNQFAVVFSEKDISDSAGVVFRFAKEQEREKAGFRLLGGADISLNIVYNTEDILRIGNLPSREILLSQLASMLQAPVRQFAYVLDQLAKSKTAKE